MAVEVELKLRVRDPQTVAARLAEHAEPVASIYQDTYYDHPDLSLRAAGERELRIRIIEDARGKRCLFTFKGVMVERSAVQSTPEYETYVDAPEDLAMIVQGLGLRPTISFRKHCRNHVWEEDGRKFTATVVRVPELDGDFLELETIVADDDERDTSIALLHKLVAGLGARIEDVDNTFYVDMVADKTGVTLRPPA